jgi:hypothetical protein
MVALLRSGSVVLVMLDIDVLSVFGWRCRVVAGTERTKAETIQALGRVDHATPAEALRRGAIFV